MDTRRPSAALAGLLATAAALSVGELSAGLVARLYSPVQAVGDTVIFYTPQPMKQFAIDTFGTNDKIALIAGTLLITLAFGAILGVVGRRRPRVAWAGIALFGLLGVAASTFQDDLLSGIPSLITALVGIPLLTWLLRLAPTVDRTTLAASPAGTSTAGTATPGAGPAEPVPAGGDRRRFLLASGGVAAAAAASVITGRSLISRRGAAVAGAREEIASQIGQTEATGSATERALGVVDEPLPPLPAGVDFGIDGLAPFQTDDADFYRIDIELAVPQIDPATWSLRIHGMVDTEIELSYEDLLRRDDLVEADITLTCVSNEVGGTLMSSGRWTGVPLANLLEEAGVQAGATQLIGRDGNGFTTGFPVDVLADGRPAMLALLLNGEPLSPERGFPARTIVPGLYGYVSATKWITEIELTTFEATQQYWVERGWDEEAPIKLQSRIDVPRPLARVPAGEVVVAGVAYHQTVGIDRVEIKVDDGEWQEAELAEELNLITWRQWRFRWQAPEAGNYRLTVRATNKAGEVQTEERQPPFPNGTTGLMTLLVTVV
jgi:DMSO/TMAO reductase YedYZ molybdopterin-dependent catalytic subunit